MKILNKNMVFALILAFLVLFCSNIILLSCVEVANAESVSEVPASYDSLDSD